MATRTIVTSQPDVECDVCGRRLLRGEHSDVFLVTGRRRTVCELCAPRAVHEGWLRETDRQSVSLPPMRPRRGRSLLDRLRQVGRLGVREDEDADDLAVPYEREEPHTAEPHTAEPHTAEPHTAEPHTAEPQPYDFLDERPAAGAAPVPATPRDAAGAPAAHGGSEGEGAGAEGELGSQDAQPPSLLDRALGLFNASEYPRRVAGVARSLGAPEVNVRSAEHAESVVRILVAWELCWYRYEVDLDEPEAGARVAAQGAELGELTREDRMVNAVADDAGVLSLA
jgi:hypothetical protein